MKESGRRLEQRHRAARLTDRVEALGGRMRIMSPAGSGTSLDVTIPLDTP
jgi:signal transduction histidine kinase